VQIAVMALVVVVNALTAVAVTRSLLPSSPGRSTALVSPAPRHVSAPAPKKPARRTQSGTALAPPAPAPPTVQSWSFPAVPNVQGRTVLVLYNPAAKPVDAHLRIVSGSSVFNPLVHIPPGSIVKLDLRPSTRGSSAVKLQSDRPIVPVRLATG
jgi:hypothetical protein